MTEKSAVNKLLTADEAVDFLRLPSRDAIYAMNARHELPVTKLGRRVRYRLSDLEAYLDARRCVVVHDLDEIEIGGGHE